MNQDNMFGDSPAEPEEPVVDNTAVELESLKNRADLMGVTYHPSIGVEKLRIKLAEAVEKAEKLMITQKAEAEAAAKKAAEEAILANARTPVIETAKPVVDPIKAARKEARNKALLLKRVRITCMDPSKKEYEGEIFCAGNSAVGMVKKYVQFQTEYHVPQIILNMIKDKKYQTFVTIKNPNGTSRREGKLIPTYAVEDLDPLTPQEYKELAQRQAMAAGTAAA